MSISGRQLNRALLGRQMLLHREAIPAADAVRRVGALQAQEPASPYIALWNRVDGFEAEDLHQAFVSHQVVKASLMRITLHAVHAADYPAFHEAMQFSLRAARLNDRRFKQAGLSIEEANSIIPSILEFLSQPRSNAEAEAWLDARYGELPKPSVWWALRTYAPFEHAPTGGPWTFGPRPAYVAAAIQKRLGDREAALKYLIRRYLQAFGPANLADFCRFALIYRSVAAGPFESLIPELERLEGPDGKPIYDVPGGLLPPEDSPAPPRLLPMWDSALLAHVDRGRTTPTGYRAVIARTNGDLLPTLLVDGYVAGVWRAIESGIEVTAFRKLSPADWDGIEAEATALGAFLAGRDPNPYGRYAHWWSGLPAAETRVFAAH